MRAALQRVIDEVLGPLLEKDSSGVELVSASEEEVIIQVTGRAAFGVGAEYVRTGIIEPAIRRVVGDDCAIRIEKTVPTAKRRR